MTPHQINACAEDALERIYKLGSPLEASIAHSALVEMRNTMPEQPQDQPSPGKSLDAAQDAANKITINGKNILLQEDWIKACNLIEKSILEYSAQQTAYIQCQRDMLHSMLIENVTFTDAQLKTAGLGAGINIEIRHDLPMIIKERDQLKTEVEELRNTPQIKHQPKMDCGHNSYWTTAFGTCMACKCEKLEADRDLFARRLRSLARIINNPSNTKYYIANDILNNNFAVLDAEMNKEK